MAVAKKYRNLSKTLIRQYLRMLEGPKGCNFHRGYKGQPIWKCKGGTDKSLSRKILKKLGVSDVDIAKVHSFATMHGGHCDCEIIFNAKKALLAKSWK